MVKALSSTAAGTGSVSGHETKILHASQPNKTKQSKKQKRYLNKFNKDFKNGPHQKIFKTELWRNKYEEFGCTPQVAKIMAPVS